MESEYDSLRVIYKEIIEGVSNLDKNIYFKHLTELDYSILEEEKSLIFTQLKKEGLPTDSEKLAQLINCEVWSAAKEEEILQCRYIISDNEKNISKVIHQQQGAIRSIIEETKKKLFTLLLERKTTFGATIDQFVEKETSLAFLSLSLYKNKTLKNKLFPSRKSTDILTEEEINYYIDLISNNFKRFSDLNIKKISVLYFFLNYFSYVKDKISDFLGKPLVNFTIYQFSLCSHGSRNLSILEQSEGSPPEIIGDMKLEEVVNWFDREYAMMIGRKNVKKKN